MKRTFFAKLLVLLSPAVMLLAQSGTGTLHGIVRGPSGAALVDVTVLVEDAGTNEVVREVQTHTGGTFEVPVLKPGVLPRNHR